MRRNTCQDLGHVVQLMRKARQLGAFHRDVVLTGPPLLQHTTCSYCREEERIKLQANVVFERKFLLHCINAIGGHSVLNL